MCHILLWVFTLETTEVFIILYGCFFNEHCFTVWNGYSWWPSLRGIVKTKIPPLSLGCALQLWEILRESINYHMSPLRENRVVRTNTRSGILGWEGTLKSPRENVWGECRTLSAATCQAVPWCFPKIPLFCELPPLCHFPGLAHGKEVGVHFSLEVRNEEVSS